MKKLFEFLQDESGATAIEYGLLLCIMVLGIIAAVQNMFIAVAVPLNTVGSSLR